ncbi:MAG: ompA [Bacteroidota bacterium]|nr:ompA [Bacteroidota bacterium]
MKKIIFLISFALLLLGALPMAAQKGAAPDLKSLTKEEKAKLDNAEYFFNDQNYLRALPLFVELRDKHPTDLYFTYRTGVCLLYKSDEKQKSVDLLNEVAKEAPDAPDIDFFLGRAYHLNYKFDEAIASFNKYLTTAPPINQRLLTERYIENSKNGKAFVEVKVKCEIENAGNVINTENQEYVPVISSDESVLIFTYMGPNSTGGLMDDDFNPDPQGNYYEDIFISHRLGDEWLTPEGIGTNINTKNHDASIALSSDGQKLFIFHSTAKDGGDIYMSELKGEVWGVPVPLGPEINTKYWEGSVSLSADERRLYFASERPGGSGGKDIYVSQKMADGTWGKAENLGPTINTQFNDDSPFIHPDGITLFFSSEGHKSIGGYDIMYSAFKDGKWSSPTNLGYPINTTEDERFYVLTADGAHGYFSSDRKGGQGQQDIYTVTPGYFGEAPILALVVGTVTADDKPVDATISVTNVDTGEKQGTYHSNSSSGKYIIALTPGNNYKVAIEVEGYEAQYQYVNVKSLDTYVQVQKDFKFQKGDPTGDGLAVKDSSNVIQDQINQQIKKYNEEKKAEVYEARVYQDLLKKYGDQKKECVTYNIELGTFENPADFNSEKLAGVDSIKKRTDEKGNTTFFVSGFKSLLDAEIMRYQVIQKDTSLKNVIVTVDSCNKRRLVQQYFANEYTRKDYNAPAETKVIKNKKGIVALTGDEVNGMVKDNGKSEIAGLTYKVEIAAVDKEEDFKLGYLSKYGKIDKKVYPDGKIRYTFGPFNTLAEADAFKKNLVEKEPEASKSIVTVFFFGQRKTLEEFNNPCDPGANGDFSAFVGKDLNDKQIYNKLIEQASNICSEGLVFRVQIGAYRKPQNFKHKNLNSLEPPPALVLPYPDGITRFTMREFKTIKDAEAFRQECIRLGTKDAWITAMYQGKRMLLQELIANNFFNKSIN